MIVMLGLLLLAPADDLQARLPHLEAAGAAWAPAPTPDGQRVAFLTTLFGGRQLASVAVQGSYPLQLTDEPSSPLEAVYVPPDGKRLVVTAVRDGQRRLLLLDDGPGSPEAIDPAAGEQFLGGATRDGKRLFYAVE